MPTVFAFYLVLCGGVFQPSHVLCLVPGLYFLFGESNSLVPAQVDQGSKTLNALGGWARALWNPSLIEVHPSS